MIDIVMDETAWLAICFAIFVILAFRPGKKAIIGFLDNKIKIIQDELNESNAARIAAENENKALREQIAASDSNRKEMLESAKFEIEALYNERCESFKKSIEYRAKAAEASFEQMKVDATSAIEGAFLDLVVDAVTSNMKKNASGKMDVQILKNAS